VKSLETDKADVQKALDAALKARDAANKVGLHHQSESLFRPARIIDMKSVFRV